MNQQAIMKSVAKAIGRARCHPQKCPWWDNESDYSPHYVSDRNFDRDMANAAVVDYIKCTSSGKYKTEDTYASRIARLNEDIICLEEDLSASSGEVSQLAIALCAAYAGRSISSIPEEHKSAVLLARKLVE